MSVCAQSLQTRYCNTVCSRLGVLPHPAASAAVLHDHDYFELIYVYEGSCSNRIDNKEITMRQGDLCLLNTYAVHSISCDQPEGNIIFNILIWKTLLQETIFKLLSYNNFVESFFLESFQKEKQEKNYVLFHCADENDPCITLIQQLIVEHYENVELPYQEYKLIHLFACFFIELIRKYQKQSDIAIKKQDKTHTITDILKYMDEHCQDITLPALAAHFNYHPKHFSRLLHQLTGQTFSQLLLDIRISHAKFLLENTGLSVSEISSQVGYQNHTWFISQFQKQQELTPAEYRSRIRNA